MNPNEYLTCALKCLALQVGWRLIHLGNSYIYLKPWNDEYFESKLRAILLVLLTCANATYYMYYYY